MIARARVPRPGRTLSVCAGDVVASSQGEERLIATMLATLLVSSRDRGSPVPEASPAGARRHAARRERRWCVCRGRSRPPAGILGSPR